MSQKRSILITVSKEAADADSRRRYQYVAKQLSVMAGSTELITGFMADALASNAGQTTAGNVA